MTDEPAFNAADKRQVGERARKQKNADAQRDSDMQAVLETPEGRRLMWKFMAACGVEGSCFNPNAAIAAYTSGKRDAGQMLKAWIVQAGEKAFLLMVQENAV
jgi:hypothetical protein